MEAMQIPHTRKHVVSNCVPKTKPKTKLIQCDAKWHAIREEFELRARGKEPVRLATTWDHETWWPEST